MPVKRKPASKAKRTMKKTATRKVATKKKLANKRPVAKKKVIAKEKVATKKPTAKKKVVKKAVAKKKVIAKKKVATKKPTAKKKVVAKKKVATKKPTAKEKVVKKTVTKKKVIAKKKPTVKKKVVKKTVVSKKVTKKVFVKEPAKNKNAKKRVTMPKIKEPTPIVNLKSVAEKIEAKKATPMVIKKEHLNHNVVGPVSSISPYQAKLGEEYMNANQLRHFMNVLIAWKRDLMEGVDKTVGHLKEDAENYPDPTDRATQEEEFSLELRTRDRERKLLRKIEGAVQRINDDDFGYCEACGIEIGLPRLEVRPTATLCIDCKTVEEIRERQIML